MVEILKIPILTWAGTQPVHNPRQNNEQVNGRHAQDDLALGKQPHCAAQPSPPTTVTHLPTSSQCPHDDSRPSIPSRCPNSPHHSRASIALPTPHCHHVQCRLHGNLHQDQLHHHLPWPPHHHLWQKSALKPGS